MVLAKLPLPGHPSDLDNSRPRAYCACSRCRWELFGHFFSPLSFLSSFSFYRYLGDGPIQTEILSQRAIKPRPTSRMCKSDIKMGFSIPKQSLKF